MNWQQFLFSFRGRVSRQQFWLMFLLSLPFITAASVVNGDFERVTAWPGCLFLLPILWPGLAVSVKRWHDRDKSGWWYLINFIPLVGAIWALVENGFLKGTTGQNRFGPDPLVQET